jgi:proteic killer suppression protein
LKRPWRAGRLPTLDINNVTRYHWFVIKSFRNKETERIFSRQFSRRFPSNLHRIAWRKLAILDAAERLEDLKIPPGNRLEKLMGDREGEHSIRINDRWRICFRWSEGDAYDVEIVDYHRG